MAIPGMRSLLFSIIFFFASDRCWINKFDEEASNIEMQYL